MTGEHIRYLESQTDGTMMRSEKVYIKAIKAKCMDCSGSKKAEDVLECTVIGCALFPYRMVGYN